MKNVLGDAIDRSSLALVKLALEFGAYADQEDLNKAKEKEGQAVELQKQNYAAIGRILKCYLDVAEPFRRVSRAEEGTLEVLSPEVKAVIARHFAQNCD